MGHESSAFEVTQGDRQGGILCADLYKMYVHLLLDRLNHTGIGAKIGNSACADDVTLNSVNEMEAQVLIETAAEYAKQERYQLQHTKTNSIRIHSNRKQYSTGQQNLNSLQINGQPINDTKEAHYIGLLQSDTIGKTMEINVEQNIKKARRTTYSLMASGLQGHNGLDPETSLQFFKTYVLPILLYGMEILLPTKTHTAKWIYFKRKY
jgi:hypothetical protein